MSKVIVKFRDQDQAIQYENVDMVMPFGSQCAAIKEGESTLIFPIARLTEMVLIQEEEESEPVIQSS